MKEGKEGVAVMVGFDLTLFESFHRVPQESCNTRVTLYGTADCRNSLPNQLHTHMVSQTGSAMCVHVYN